MCEAFFISQGQLNSFQPKLYRPHYFNSIDLHILWILHSNKNNQKWYPFLGWGVQRLHYEKHFTAEDPVPSLVDVTMKEKL